MRPGPFHASCPVCAHPDPKPLWDVDGYAIVRCAGCTLVFVANRLTPEQLAAHYAAVEDPVYDEDNRACLDYYYQALKRRIEDQRPTPGAILDVGCSGGWFLEAMAGWDVYGCEIAASDAAIARARFGDRIFEGTLEAYPEREGFFDVITLQDVFDHCAEPLPVLEKCRRMLKPGGLLVIKVHNISCLYAKATGRRFYALLPPSHLFYYDERTLKLAVEKAGMRMTGAAFIAHLLKVSTIFFRLSRGDKRSPFFKLHAALQGTALGRMTIKKNLHDVITVFAVAPAA